MSVYKLENGTVMQVWKSVADLDAWRDQYGPDMPTGLTEGEAYCGQVLVDGALCNPPPNADQITSDTRRERDELLAATDWRMLSDAGSDAAAWSNYRQALRDITDQAGFPKSITWPVEP